MRKNIQIQFIRGIFCLLIVFFHFTYRYSQLYNVGTAFTNNGIISHFGEWGVLTFFIISGIFLIPAKEIIGIKAKIIYMLKRVLNIWLVYLFAIIIIFIISLFGVFPNDRTVGFKEFIQNIFFINYFTGCGYVDGSHWYIAALMILFFWMFVGLLINKQKNSFYWIIIVCASCVSYLVNRFIYSHFILRMVFSILDSHYLYAALLGICMLRIKKIIYNKEKMFSKIDNVGWLIIGAVSMIMLAIINVHYVWMYASSLLLIALALFEKLSFVEKAKPIVLIGNASFSIYLFHQNIGYFLIDKISKSIGYYPSFVIVFLLVIIVGTVIHLFVELRIKKLVNMLINKITPNKGLEIAN